MPTSQKRSDRSSRDLIESLEQRLLFAFGLTTSSSLYTVDTGAQLVFSIARTAGSGSVGDLTSMKLSGTDLEAPFSVSSRYSHYESGLSSATVVTATVDPNNQWILISCDDTGSTGVGVIQYYLARKGYNNIYMATYSAGPNSPSPGEMRFITYTNPTVLTNIPAPSNNNGNTGAIESSDIFGHADGTTTSKYYGEYRAIDTQTYGDTGNGFGIFMNIGNRETSSGGPFFKDIDFQNNELYTYTFSGHSQTENFRPGLKGFYALELTTGANPGAPDYTFIDSLGVGSYITGYTGATGRGSVTGTASGVPSTLQSTVALSNAADQYWALPDPTTGAYTISGVLPGTYTETIYQGELSVGTQSVVVSAGQTTGVNINDTFYTPSAANTVFRIGTWDGTPLGFLNANLISNMHPTDVRMSPWAADSTGLTNFIVGTSADSTWPMAEWHAQNSTTPYVDTDNRITFTLTAAQAATAMTFRIGLTRLDSARPNITVNSSYTTAVQSIASQPTARGLTTGNWRGNNVTYSFNLPTTSLHAGTNTIDIYSVSGSTGTLYAGYHIYDAVDLVTTSSITNAPVVKTLVISPTNATLPVNGKYVYTVQAYDQTGTALPSNSTWSSTIGSIDNTGTFLAPANASSGTITATVGSVSTTTNVTVVVGTPPTVATPASASPNPVTGTTTTLSVLGADDGGESNLTYTWSATGPAGVTYSVNSTNAAKNSVATLTTAGTYKFTVTIKDAQNLFTTSTVQVSVVPTAYTGSTGSDAYAIRISPSDSTIEQIFVNASESSTPTYTIPIRQVSMLSFTTASDGTLVVDFTNGNPIPTNGINFSGGNTLSIEGNSAGGLGFTINGNQVVYTAAASSPITYTNVAHVEFDLAGGSNALTQLAQPATALTYNAGTGSNTLAINVGMFTLTTDPRLSSGNLTVNDYASLVLNPPANGYTAMNFAALNLYNTAVATVTASGSSTARTVIETGSLTVATTATLDMANNAMIVHAGDFAALSSLIQRGFNNGGWTGHGVNSSKAAADTTHLTALGILSNNNSGGSYYTSFDGQAAVPGDVLVKYTYYGDANLDGKVDGSDYSRIDSGLLNQATGWFNGDFNYDTVINGSDYTLIDNAFNTQGAVQAAEVAAPGSATQTGVRCVSVFSNTTIIQTADTNQKHRHRVIDSIQL